VVVVVLLACIISNLTSNSSNASSSTANQQASTSTQVSQSTQPTTVPTKQPTATPTQAPTATPVPTETQAQQEINYKNSTTSTTVTNLDKDGSSDQGKDVHFTGAILNFIKNPSGNTEGANVDEQGYSSSSVIQILFTPDTNLSSLNQGDIIEIWGQDLGVFSETNAFGGSIQEVVIQAQYMNDQTTGYQANS
jgi:cytoskeletal protein RodZ